MELPDDANDATGVDSGPVENAGGLAVKRSRRRAKVLDVRPETIRRRVVVTMPDGREKIRTVKSTRWKLVGYYDSGVRKREYFADEPAAKARLATLKLQLSNLGARAAHIGGALAEDAIRAEKELAPLRVGLLEAVREYVRARESLAASGATLAEVVAAHAGQHKARQASMALSKLGAAFLKDRETNGASEFYRGDAKRRWRRLEEFCGSDTPACDVTPETAVEFLDSLGVGAKSRENFMRNLSAVFGFGVKRGYLARNPFAALDKPKVVAKPPGIFTPKEMAVLLAHASEDWRPVLAIGGFAGLRPEEIRRMEWRHVDFEAGLIEVEAAHSKTAQRRLVHMAANLRAILATYKARKGPVAPVPGTERKRRLAAMQAAGIARWPVDVLRHSFASYHLAHHKDAAALALEMGHSSPKMIFGHYRELVKPVDAAEWWSLTPSRKGGRKAVVRKAHASK
ncbi:MAG: tyrosine-type recombinase/integrase [Verrucomicrobiales bacterium]